MTKSQSYRAKSPRPQIRYGNIWTAIQALSRIHDGPNGQSIPAVVMDFYKGMKGGDAHRPGMLKVVVLAMADAIKSGTRCRHALQNIAMRRLARSVALMPLNRLEGWLRDDPRRARFMPTTSNTRSDCLRAAWLEEGREVIADVLNYAQAMV
ncbi:hypothetical protein [Methylobacterium sp. J-077]|uniref:hypothetical protein n=1 Tax=Methylobacterium sp. J-077 TaxID=2836656 RepID=UPI001FBBD668|nr:hypothetical protein [Methylobacterium sp. J-077]MCJ2124926.1 hypothetical protein [Methylobacterium sp. J-077]